MISFGKAPLKRKPGEKERFSPRVEITLASLPQGEDFLLSIKRQRHELCVRQGGIAIGRIEYAAVTRPVHSKKSILCVKTAHIDYSEANFHLVIANLYRTRLNPGL
jgi:hypothetical protein